MTTILYQSLIIESHFDDGQLFILNLTQSNYTTLILEAFNFIVRFVCFMSEVIMSNKTFGLQMLDHQVDNFRLNLSPLAKAFIGLLFN